MKVFINEWQTPVHFTNSGTILESLYHPITCFSSKLYTDCKIHLCALCQLLPPTGVFVFRVLHIIWWLRKSLRNLVSASRSSLGYPEPVHKLSMLFSWWNRDKMAANCCRQWCFIRVCKSLRHPLIQSRRTIHLHPAIQTSQNSPFKSVLIQVTSVFKSFRPFSLLLQEVPVLWPSHQICANVLFSFWAWFSIFLHVTPFVWNSFADSLKFSWFTWPFNSSSLLSAPTFTLNLQVHLSKLH